MELIRLKELPEIAARYEAIAVIGDGPSKLRYIFNPLTVLTIAVNRASLDYPCAMAVVMEPHLDQLLAVANTYVPLVYISRFDMVEHELPGGRWTATIFLQYVMKSIPGPVYLQGFDLSVDRYAAQAGQFERIVEHNPDRFFLTHEVKPMPFINAITPPPRHVL